MWKFVVCCFFVFLMTVSAGSAMAASKIAFTSSRDGNQEIYVMDADGSNQTNLTNHAANDESPTWSPDGTQIAFYSDRDGPADIYVMDADGSNQTRLTTDPQFASHPAWSPELPASVASISPFGQFVIVFMLGGASALWMTRRQHAASHVASL